MKTATLSQRHHIVGGSVVRDRGLISARRALVRGWLVGGWSSVVVTGGDLLGTLARCGLARGAGRLATIDLATTVAVDSVRRVVLTCRAPLVVSTGDRAESAELRALRPVITSSLAGEFSRSCRPECRGADPEAAGCTIMHRRADRGSMQAPSIRPARFATGAELAPATKRRGDQPAPRTPASSCARRTMSTLSAVTKDGPVRIGSVGASPYWANWVAMSTP